MIHPSLHAFHDGAAAARRCAVSNRAIAFADADIGVVERIQGPHDRDLEAPRLFYWIPWSDMYHTVSTITSVVRFRWFRANGLLCCCMALELEATRENPLERAQWYHKAHDDRVRVVEHESARVLFQNQRLNHALERPPRPDTGACHEYEDNSE
ncbi:hypothetical protein FI667_g333, partial [Globisporangium splendens]